MAGSVAVAVAPAAAETVAVAVAAAAAAAAAAVAAAPTLASGADVAQQWQDGSGSCASNFSAYHVGLIADICVATLRRRGAGRLSDLIPPSKVT